MPKRRKKKKKKTLQIRSVAILAAVAGLVALILYVGHDRTPKVSVQHATERDFGDRLRDLAARRGASARDVDGDRPIRKIKGVFVRTWRIRLPDKRRVRALEADLEAEAPRWQATFRRQKPLRGEVARGRFSLGREAFDIHLSIRRGRTPGERAGRTAAATRAEPTARPTLAPWVRGRLAILLDDAGQNMKVIPAVAALPRQVAVAVLPFLPHSAEAAVTLSRAGHEVWLHLPMEPNGYPKRDPGPGAVLVSMPEAEVRSTVRAALNNVPGIVGVNNHMGSRATADLRTMTWVMQEIAARGLDFIDSRTTAATVAEDAARAQGIPAGRRRVFLDNRQSPTAIHRQLAEAVDYARRHGSAIAIGHVHPTTIRVLAIELPQLPALGADLVPPSKLVR